jgi:hypothetical protein
MNKKKINMIFIGIIIVAHSGCISSNFTRTGKVFPEYRGIVKVFGKAPKKLDYIQISIFSASGNQFSKEDNASMIKKNFKGRPLNMVPMQLF